MQGGVEIAGKYAQAYAKAPKKDKGWILDELCSVTGWSRDNAHRRLVTAAKCPSGCRKSEPRVKASRYFHEALRGLQRV
jgi:integrase family protein